MKKTSLPINQRFCLTPEEASCYFGISVRRLYEIIKQNQGADFFTYNGRRILILREAFERFLTESTRL